MANEGVAAIATAQVSTAHERRTAPRVLRLFMLEPMDEWGLVADIAARQHYTVATWQTSVLGISRAALAARVSRQRWRRRHRGVIQLPGPDTPARELAAAVLAYSRPARAEQRVATFMAEGLNLTAAVVEAALGCGQAVCGPSALWLHGIADWDGPPWIRLPRGNGQATRADVRIRHGAPTSELVRIDGIPVVDVAQAVMDLPGCLRELTRGQLHHRLVRTLSTADAKRLVELEGLTSRIEEVDRFYGVDAVRRAVADLRGGLSHSGTERWARAEVVRIAEDLGFKVHPRPYQVVHDGVTIAEADIAIVQLLLDIEVDGPHHRLPAQRDADQLRDRKLRRAHWEVERFPTDLIDLRPAVFRARVKEAIEARGRARPQLSA